MSKDVLQYIFKYLKPHELFVVMSVNKMWYKCATDNLVWYHHKQYFLNNFHLLEPYFDTNNPIYKTINYLKNINFTSSKELGILSLVYRSSVFDGFKNTITLKVDYKEDTIETLTPYYNLEDGGTCILSEIDWTDESTRYDVLENYYYCLMGTGTKRKRIKR